MPLSVTLQILEAYGNSLAARLADQMFTVVLLVGFAIYALRKIKQLEEKLDKYMEDDRHQMLEVLKNNTRAFELFNARMAKMVLVIGFGFMSLVSCRSVKSSVYKSNTHITDSSVISAYQYAKELHDRSVEREVKDSAIIVVGRSLSLNGLSLNQLSPLYDKEGNKMPQKTQKRANGIGLEITANTNGTIDIDASCDSLTLIVKGLIRENAILKMEKDSGALIVGSHSRVTSALESTSQVKTRYPGWLLGCMMAVGLSVGCLLIYAVVLLGKLIKAIG